MGLNYNYWYRCDGAKGYVFHSELYQGRKESNELNLGPSLVLNLFQTLKNTYYYAVFDNVCNIPEQIQKLREDRLYDLATA